MIASRFVPRLQPSSVIRRLSDAPVYLVVVVSVLAVGIAMVSGTANLNVAVKLAMAVVALIAAVAITLSKPVLFPLSAYLFMVPFDNLLQTGFGTVTKFLAIWSIVAVLLIMTDRRRTLTPPLAAFLWLAYLLWSFASLIWSETQAASLYWLQTVVALYALYAILSLLRIREREVRVLVAAVVAGGSVCAAYGTWLFVQGTAFAANSAAISRLNLSFGSTASINADHFAGALVAPIAFALVTAQRRSGALRWLACGGLAVMFAGLFVSAARGSFIAVGLMLVYITVASNFGRRMLMMLTAVGLSASFAVPNVWLRFFDPSQGQAGGRYGIWAVAWEAFRHHWLVGVGTGDFRTAYSDAYLAVFQGTAFHAWAEDSHNLIASTSVELGSIGLLLVLAAWFYQFRTVSVIPRTSSLSDLRLGAEAGIIGLFVVAMTADLIWFKYLWLVFTLSVLIRNAYVCETQAAESPA